MALNNRLVGFLLVWVYALPTHCASIGFVGASLAIFSSFLGFSLTRFASAGVSCVWVLRALAQELVLENAVSKVRIFQDVSTYLAYTAT